MRIAAPRKISSWKQIIFKERLVQTCMALFLFLLFFATFGLVFYLPSHETPLSRQQLRRQPQCLPKAHAVRQLTDRLGSHFKRIVKSYSAAVERNEPFCILPWDHDMVSVDRKQKHDGPKLFNFIGGYE